MNSTLRFISLTHSFVFIGRTILLLGTCERYVSRYPTFIFLFSLFFSRCQVRIMSSLTKKPHMIHMFQFHV